MPNNPPVYNPNQDELQAQLEAQAQLEGQLQGQGELQAQGEGQGQGQGQAQVDLQGQAQGEAQGQDQGQEQHQTTTVYNWDGNLNGNANGNANGNGNLNANGNLNGNANINVNDLDNRVDNKVDNEVTSKVNVDVDVKAEVSSQPPPGDHDIGIDMAHLGINVDHLDGSLFLMPNNIAQTINGGGEAATNVLFNLDQVNNLVSNGEVAGVSLANNGSFNAWAQADGGDATGIGLPAGQGGDKFDFFKQDGQPGAINFGSGNGESGTVTATADASGAAQLDAFTQSIVMGANIQYNAFDMSVVGHDAITYDHAEAHH